VQVQKHRLTPSMSENCFCSSSNLLLCSLTTLSTDDITFARSSSSTLSFSPWPDYSIKKCYYQNGIIYNCLHHFLSKLAGAKNMTELILRLQENTVNYLCPMKSDSSVKIWQHYCKQPQFSKKYVSARWLFEHPLSACYFGFVIYTVLLLCHYIYLRDLRSFEIQFELELAVRFETDWPIQKFSNRVSRACSLS